MYRIILTVVSVSGNPVQCHVPIDVARQISPVYHSLLPPGGTRGNWMMLASSSGCSKNEMKLFFLIQNCGNGLLIDFRISYGV